MPSPGIKEVLKLSRKYNMIPVYKEMPADLMTPLSAYLKIDDPEYSFLLESIEGGEKTARYSFLGRGPYETFYYRNGEVHKTIRGKESVIRTLDPFAELRAEFKKIKAAPVAGLPAFAGGAVGYIGYDVIKLYEKVPHENKKDMLGWPDMYFMFTDILMIFDHVYHKIQVVHNIFIEEKDTAAKIRKKHAAAVAKIDFIIRDMEKPLKKTGMRKHPGPLGIKACTEKKQYMEKVKKAVALIKNGEGIQVVPSQRFYAAYNGDPLAVYRSLRTINPSPYMHFLRLGNIRIIGASPELMVKVTGRDVEVKPIAGTRRRGATEAEDKALEREMLGSPKERAEHVMLVDLGRNDIGRVAETGSVKVKDVMAVERYSHVMHIVSGVTGKLKKGMDAFDAFVSTFPAGTVSGAPKVWAMQTIDSLEDIKRGPYSGAVGYISFTGDMTTCISIRTIYYNKGKVYMQAGGGVVADSRPEAEYAETLNKAKAVFKAVEAASEKGGQGK